MVRVQEAEYGTIKTGKHAVAGAHVRSRRHTLVVFVSTLTVHPLQVAFVWTNFVWSAIVWIGPFTT